VIKLKRIKPGRGPSGMSFIGSIVVVIFGVFWTIMAASITAGSPFGIIGIIFPLFGVLFIILGVVQAIYHYKNATGKDRYSIIDIVDSNEEGDPSDNWIKNRNEGDMETQNSINSEINYCPYCGAKANNDYTFCPKCGKSIKE